MLFSAEKEGVGYKNRQSNMGWITRRQQPAWLLSGWYAETYLLLK